MVQQASAPRRERGGDRATIHATDSRDPPPEVGSGPQSPRSGRERVVDIKAVRALPPPSLRPRSQAITPPAPHAASPLEPQAQKHLRTTNVVESPFAAVRLRTAAAKRFKKVENATAVIWKTLLIAEQSFRRLDAPERLPEVAEGVAYVDGVRAAGQREGRRLIAFTHCLTRPRLLLVIARKRGSLVR
jgi:hypothetical protein